jgi:hypothetical protein
MCSLFTSRGVDIKASCTQWKRSSSRSENMVHHAAAPPNTFHNKIEEYFHFLPYLCGYTLRSSAVVQSLSRRITVKLSEEKDLIGHKCDIIIDDFVVLAAFREQ